jgi:hypothetical protein
MTWTQQHQGLREVVNRTTLIILDTQKNVAFITRKIVHTHSQTIYQRLIGEWIRVLSIFCLLIQFVHTLRLDIQHYAVQHATGKRFFAPITEPWRAIDLGTGSGTWMLASIRIACIMPIIYQYPL